MDAFAFLGPILRALRVLLRASVFVVAILLVAVGSCAYEAGKRSTAAEVDQAWHAGHVAGIQHAIDPHSPYAGVVNVLRALEADSRARDD